MALRKSIYYNPDGNERYPFQDSKNSWKIRVVVNPEGCTVIHNKVQKIFTIDSASLPLLKSFSALSGRSLVKDCFDSDGFSKSECLEMDPFMAKQEYQTTRLKIHLHKNRSRWFVHASVLVCLCGR